MSALPKAVQNQIKRANELAEGLVAAKNPQPPQPPQPPPQPAPVAAAPAPAAPVEPPAQPSGPVDWEHKFKVLQGKYNAEVPRLTRQFQEQEQRLRDLSQQLLNTQTQLASLGNGKSAQAAPPAQPAQRHVKDEEINTFGADLFDFVKRAAREELAGDLNTVRMIEQRLVKTEQTTENVAATTARTEVQKVYDLLNTHVPDWEQQNADPEFLQWLQEKDPYAGVPRGQLLAQAYETHDGPRVVAFFQGYKNESAAIQSTTAAPAAPAAPAAAQPEVQLASLVAPGTPKSGPQGGAPSDAGKRVWNQADAQSLYRAINEFTKKGKPVPKELRAAEADLIKAQAEGRLAVK